MININQPDVADLAEPRLLGGGREFFEFGTHRSVSSEALLAGELADEVEDDAGVHVGRVLPSTDAMPSMMTRSSGFFVQDWRFSRMASRRCSSRRAGAVERLPQHQAVPFLF